MILFKTPNRDALFGEIVDGVLHAVVMTMVAGFSLMIVLRSMNIV